MPGRKSLLTVSCSLIHHRLFHMNTLYLNLARKCYLSLRQSYIRLTKNELCVYSLKMAIYVSRNMLQ